MVLAAFTSKSLLWSLLLCIALLSIKEVLQNRVPFTWAAFSSVPRVMIRALRRYDQRLHLYIKKKRVRNYYAAGDSQNKWLFLLKLWRITFPLRCIGLVGDENSLVTWGMKVTWILIPYLFDILAFQATLQGNDGKGPSSIKLHSLCYFAEFNSMSIDSFSCLKSNSGNFRSREGSTMRMHLSQLLYTLVVVWAEQSVRNLGVNNGKKVFLIKVDLDPQMLRLLWIEHSASRYRSWSCLQSGALPSELKPLGCCWVGMGIRLRIGDVGWWGIEDRGDWGFLR